MFPITFPKSPAILPAILPKALLIPPSAFPRAESKLDNALPNAPVKPVLLNNCWTVPGKLPRKLFNPCPKILLNPPAKPCKKLSTIKFTSPLVGSKIVVLTFSTLLAGAVPAYVFVFAFEAAGLALAAAAAVLLG